jgi:hypothetical protein
MKKRGIAFAVVGLCSLLLVFSPIAQASPVFGLDYLVSGVQPDGNGNTPWLSAVFEDVVPGQVRLTMGAGNLSGSSQFVSDWYFNLDFKTGLKFSYEASDGPAAFGISFNPNGDLKKGFNLQFSFFTANNDSTRFDAGEFVTYLFTGDGLTASLFDVANENGYLTMAHVQGIGSQEGSAWIAAQKSSDQSVPEPTTMLLLGVGLIGLGFFGRKRFLK